jgi:2-keto-4-pentenoate hydratase/2-oxohepta-3-ene-1,7-dioic acid hydratase in catechol pathway
VGRPDRRQRRPGRSEQVVPGELFSIGALLAGNGMKIGRWLRHGDTLELDLPGIGHITHRVK